MFTTSIGIAESPGSGDLPSLLARADLAMYEAKKAGGACFRVLDKPADQAPGTSR
jgi:GGDEF domain-containing protein